VLLLMQLTWLDVRVSGVTRSGIGAARRARSVQTRCLRVNVVGMALMSAARASFRDRLGSRRAGVFREARGAEALASWIDVRLRSSLRIGWEYASAHWKGAFNE